MINILQEHGSLYDLLHNETVPFEGELAMSFLRDLVQGINRGYILKLNPC